MTYNINMPPKTTKRVIMNVKCMGKGPIPDQIDEDNNCFILMHAFDPTKEIMFLPQDIPHKRTLVESIEEFKVAAQEIITVVSEQILISLKRMK